VEARSPFFDTLVGKRIAGRYLVERLIGSGGMGIVAAARYPELGQKVAIKFLRPELAADTVVSARFMREARVAAKVKSSHFVRVFDVGRLESGVPYLVMGMLAGRDLGDELRTRGPLPVGDAVDLVLQAMAGVAEIHALGIVHRDLKPSNLFIAEVAGTSIVKVLDFGISKEKQTESLVPLTGTDHVLGTPQYMSPEQIKASRDVDARSDVWSLGVILYELVTKSLPFVSEGGGVGEMFGKILYVDPDPPSKHRADLPEGFAAVVMKCLERTVAARHASVIELAEALRPYLNAGSSHRIDAVRQAASAPPVDVDDGPILEVAEGAESERGPHARTQESSPEAKRERLVLAPTAPASPAEENPAPVTAMTTSSVVTTAKRPKAPGSGKLIAGLALGAVVIGGAVWTFAVRDGASGMTAGSASASASASATSAAASTSAGTVASAEPSAAPSAAPSAVAVATTIPSASASSVAAVASAKPKVTAPVVRPTVRPTASVAPLILDRK